MDAQSCVSFVDLFQYVRKCKDLVDGTSVPSKAYLFLPQGAVNAPLNPTYGNSAKDLAYDWHNVIPLQFVHSHKSPFFGRFTISVLYSGFSVPCSLPSLC